MEMQQWVSFALLSNYKIFLLLTLRGTENSLKVFSFVMEMQQWVSFALLSNYKIFPTAPNNINVLQSSRKVPDSLSDFNLI
jgi:hypothetical protein